MEVTVARIVSSLAAVLAAGGGLLALGAAAREVFAPTLGAPDFRDLAMFTPIGCVLLGYAAAHLAFCCRPRNWLAVTLRAAFTAGIVWSVVIVMQRALAPEPAPADPELARRCGMSWLADLGRLLALVAMPGFVALEFAAWCDWWRRVRRPQNPA